MMLRIPSRYRRAITPGSDYLILQRWGILLGAMLLMGSLLETGFASDAVRERILQKLQADPEDASSWRLLGRLLYKRGEFQESEDSLSRSLLLDPTRAAAHFDYGQTLLKLGQQTKAVRAFRETIRLAPESDYAQSARSQLELLGIPEREILLLEESTEETDTGDPLITIVSHEVTRFDGSDKPPDRDDSFFQSLIDPEKVFDVKLELGFQYNSNVALAPTSRQLVPGDRESFQFFINPDIEWTLWKNGANRFGALYGGQWTFNESHFDKFNLESYQPGLFWETSIFRGDTEIIPRLDYEFTHDEFLGTTFANRHSLTASSLVLWDDIESTYAYWTIDGTNYLQDGLTPSLTSQDGLNNMAGINHEWYWRDRFWKSFSVGADLQRTDTDGANFRFHGIQVYVESEYRLATGWDLELDAGYGYRDYFDFVGTPTRNEHNWRAGLELEKRINDHMRMSFVVRYSRFDSENPLFDADRFLAGIVSRFDF